MAKGCWLWASAFLTAWLPPHRPLIHLTQQEASKLPFQQPSPARCGLCAFLYHPWQELCYTSWREQPPQRGHRAEGSFQLQQPLLPGHLPRVSPSNTLPGHPWALTALANSDQSPKLGPEVGVGILEGQQAGGQSPGKCGRQEGAPLALCLRSFWLVSPSFLSLQPLPPLLRAHSQPSQTH